MTTDGPPGPFFGALEAVTSAGITGWAFRAGADAPLRLTLRFDDLPPLDLPCDRARPDLWAWRPDLHAACRHGPRIGFATPVPPPLHNGKPHRLVLSDEAGNILPLTLPGASPGQPVTFTLPAADLLGHVARDGTRVVGWAIAIDPATGERRGSNEVRIADADGTILTVTAADDRPDVARLLGAPPNCGFDVLLPAAARGVLLVTIGPDAADLPGSPLPALPPAVKPPPDTDPDDPRFAFSALPRRALFGITRQLDAISRAIPADAPIDPAAYPDEPQRSIAPVFDRGFYLDSYPDVRAHGIDPVTHFCASGWRELRWPAPWFDTGFYLDDNPDVRDAGINPFRHYLNSGRQEGRPARRPGGHRPQVIAALIAPEARMAGAHQPPAGDRLTQGQLLVALNTLCADAKGLIASVSHDHYRDAIGGVQLCVEIGRASCRERV